MYTEFLSHFFSVIRVEYSSHDLLQVDLPTKRKGFVRILT